MIKQTRKKYKIWLKATALSVAFSFLFTSILAPFANAKRFKIHTTNLNDRVRKTSRFQALDERISRFSEKDLNQDIRLIKETLEPVDDSTKLAAAGSRLNLFQGAHEWVSRKRTLSTGWRLTKWNLLYFVTSPINAPNTETPLLLGVVALIENFIISPLLHDPISVIFAKLATVLILSVIFSAGHGDLIRGSKSISETYTFTSALKRISGPFWQRYFGGILLITPFIIPDQILPLPVWFAVSWIIHFFWNLGVEAGWWNLALLSLTGDASAGSGRWSNKAEVVEAVREAISKYYPELMDRYNELYQYDQQLLKELREDIYKITRGELIRWGLEDVLKAAILRRYFGGDFRKLLKEVFDDPRLGFEIAEMKKFWLELQREKRVSRKRTARSDPSPKTELQNNWNNILSRYREFRTMSEGDRQKLSEDLAAFLQVRDIPEQMEKALILQAEISEEIKRVWGILGDPERRVLVRRPILILKHMNLGMMSGNAQRSISQNKARPIMKYAMEFYGTELLKQLNADPVEFRGEQPAIGADTNGDDELEQQFEKYLKREGYSQYEELKKSFTPAVKKALLEDAVLQPVFMVVLDESRGEAGPLKVVDKEVLDQLEMGEMKGESILRARSCFLAGSEEIANQMARNGYKVVAGVTDRYYNNLFDMIKVANRRQAYFPLNDGTWLGVKGSGDFETILMPFDWNTKEQRYDGLATGGELDDALNGYSVFGKSGGRFVQLLGYRKVYKLPDGEGHITKIESVYDPEGNNVDHVLIFNRVITPHRFTKIQQLLESDRGLMRFTERISAVFVNLGYQPIHSTEDLMRTIVYEFGREEGIKQNAGLFKLTPNDQDLSLSGEEADNEETKTKEDYIKLVPEDGFTPGTFGDEVNASPLLINDGLSINGLSIKLLVIWAIAEKVFGPEGIYLERFSDFDLIRLLFTGYFKELNNQYLTLWIDPNKRNLLGLALFDILSGAGFNLEKFSEIIYSLAQEEAERRGLINTTADSITESGNTGGIIQPLKDFIFKIFPKLSSADYDLGIAPWLENLLAYGLTFVVAYFATGGNVDLSTAIASKWGWGTFVAFHLLNFVGKDGARSPPILIIHRSAQPKPKYAIPNLIFSIFIAGVSLYYNFSPLSIESIFYIHLPINLFVYLISLAARRILHSDRSILFDQNNIKRLQDFLSDKDIKKITLVTSENAGIGDEVIFLTGLIPILTKKYPHAKIKVRSLYPWLWKFSQPIQLIDTPRWKLWTFIENELTIEFNVDDQEFFNLSVGNERAHIDRRDIRRDHSYKVNAYAWKSFFEKVFEVRPEKNEGIKYLIDEGSLEYQEGLAFVEEYASDPLKPKILFNGFGGEREEKGFVSVLEQAKFIAELVNKTDGTIFVVLNHRATQNNRIERLHSEINMLLGSKANQVVYLPPTDENKTMTKVVAFLCDMGVTVEGGMMHLLYALGKPFLSIHHETNRGLKTDIQNQSGASGSANKWFPLEADKDLQRSFDIHYPFDEISQHPVRVNQIMSQAADILRKVKSKSIKRKDDLKELIGGVSNLKTFELILRSLGELPNGFHVVDIPSADPSQKLGRIPLSLNDEGVQFFEELLNTRILNRNVYLLTCRADDGNRLNLPAGMKILPYGILVEGTVFKDPQLPYSAIPYFVNLSGYFLNSKNADEFNPTQLAECSSKLLFPKIHSSTHIRDYPSLRQERPKNGSLFNHHKFNLLVFDSDRIFPHTKGHSRDFQKVMQKYKRLLRGKSVLEIGVGTGVEILYALKYGARAVSGTDISPTHVMLTKWNLEYAQETGQIPSIPDGKVEIKLAYGFGGMPPHDVYLFNAPAVAAPEKIINTKYKYALARSICMPTDEFKALFAELKERLQNPHAIAVWKILIGSDTDLVEFVENDIPYTDDPYTKLFLGFRRRANKFIVESGLIGKLVSEHYRGSAANIYLLHSPKINPLPYHMPAIIALTGDNRWINPEESLQRLYNVWLQGESSRDQLIYEARRLGFDGLIIENDIEKPLRGNRFPSHDSYLTREFVNTRSIYHIGIKENNQQHTYGNGLFLWRETLEGFEYLSFDWGPGAINSRGRPVRNIGRIFSNRSYRRGKPFAGLNRLRSGDGMGLTRLAEESFIVRVISLNNGQVHVADKSPGQNGNLSSLLPTTQKLLFLPVESNTATGFAVHGFAPFFKDDYKGRFSPFSDNDTLGVVETRHSKQIYQGEWQSKPAQGLDELMPGDDVTFVFHEKTRMHDYAQREIRGILREVPSGANQGVFVFADGKIIGYNHVKKFTKHEKTQTITTSNQEQTSNTSPIATPINPDDLEVMIKLAQKQGIINPDYIQNSRILNIDSELKEDVYHTMPYKEDSTDAMYSSYLFDLGLRSNDRAKYYRQSANEIARILSPGGKFFAALGLSIYSTENIEFLNSFSESGFEIVELGIGLGYYLLINKKTETIAENINNSGGVMGWLKKLTIQYVVRPLPKRFKNFFSTNYNLAVAPLWENFLSFLVSGVIFGLPTLMLTGDMDRALKISYIGTWFILVIGHTSIVADIFGSRAPPENFRDSVTIGLINIALGFLPLSFPTIAFLSVACHFSLNFVRSMIPNIDSYLNMALTRNKRLTINAFDVSTPTELDKEALAKQIERAYKTNSLILVPLISKNDFIDIFNLKSELQYDYHLKDEMFSNVCFGGITVTRKDLLPMQSIDPAFGFDMTVLDRVLRAKLAQTLTLDKNIFIQVFTSNSHLFKTVSKITDNIQVLLLISNRRVVPLTPAFETEFISKNTIERNQ